MTSKTRAALDRTFRRAFANYKPPEPLTVSQWAERYRVLSRESAAEAGPWRNARTPYLVDIMDAFNDPRVREISVVAPSQVGKSEAQLNAIGYIIDQDPASTIYIQPNLDDAKKFSRTRIAPMLRDSPRLRDKVSEVRSRDSGNTVLQKSFPGGMLTIVGSQSPSALASTPARYVIGDEVDRWALSAGTEGDPWGLATARTTTYYNAKMMAVSTPTLKGFSRIEDLFNGGTQEHWCTQCPDCGEWHEIILDDIRFDHESTEHKRAKQYSVSNVTWCCPSCGTAHTEEEMRRQPARWIADAPEAIKRGRRSFWMSAFASPWRGWDEICLKFLESKDDPEKFKVFYNTILGQLWEDRGDVADEDTLLARREDYGTRTDGKPVDLPEGVLVLTMGVDTQKDWFSYEVVGHGYNGETWGIKKGIVIGDPDDDATWVELDRIIDGTYFFEDGTGLGISFTFIDSGGASTQSVYRHCRDRLSKRVFAIKGQGGDGVPYVRPPSKQNILVNGRTIGQVWLYVLGVDAGKASIVQALRVQEPGPKYCHFPLGDERGYDWHFFNELTAERRVQKRERGRVKWVWEQLLGHARNEAFDVRNYSNAAFQALDPDLDAVRERLIARRSAKKEQPPAEVKRPAKKRGVVRRAEKIDDW